MGKGGKAEGLGGHEGKYNQKKQELSTKSSFKTLYRRQQTERSGLRGEGEGEEGASSHEPGAGPVA